MFFVLIKNFVEYFKEFMVQCSAESEGGKFYRYITSVGACVVFSYILMSYLSGVVRKCRCSWQVQMYLVVIDVPPKRRCTSLVYQCSPYLASQLYGIFYEVYTDVASQSNCTSIVQLYQILWGVEYLTGVDVWYSYLLGEDLNFNITLRSSGRCSHVSL